MAGRVFAHKMNIGDVRVVTAAGAITMVNEGVLIVNKTVGAASAVAMQSDPITGDFIFIVDGKGDAATNNITITPAQSKTIDGAATYVISENYASVLLFYNGTEWNVVSAHKENASQASATFTTVTATTANATTANLTTANITNATTTLEVATTLNAATLTETGALNLTQANTLAATGTVIGNAAAVVATVTDVTGADNTVGVVLPATVAGKVYILYSSTATSGLMVYPPVNSAINGGTANAAIVLEGKTLALFVATNSSNWASMFTLNT